MKSVKGRFFIHVGEHNTQLMGFALRNEKYYVLTLKLGKT